MDIIERAARNLCALNEESQRDTHWEMYVSDVRALLMIIREPDEGMIEAGFYARDNERSAIKIWQAMIDAALKG